MHVRACHNKDNTMDILIISTTSVLFLLIAYALYMRKEVQEQNLGTRSSNGSGEGFYGKRGAREDGSYITTKWFMILLVPIIPLGTYRVWRGKSTQSFFAGLYSGVSQSTEVRLERLKMNWAQVLSTYAVLILALLFVLGFVIFAFNFPTVGLLLFEIFVFIGMVALVAWIVKTLFNKK